MSLNKMVKWQTINAEATSAHGYRVTPQLQSLQVTLPIGGLLWSRPVAILVQKDDLQHRIPIVDATRVAQLMIYAFAIVMLLRSRLNSAANAKQ